MKACSLLCLLIFVVSCGQGVSKSSKNNSFASSQANNSSFIETSGSFSFNNGKMNCNCTGGAANCIRIDFEFMQRTVGGNEIVRLFVDKKDSYPKVDPVTPITFPGNCPRSLLNGSLSKYHCDTNSGDEIQIQMRDPATSFNNNTPKNVVCNIVVPDPQSGQTITYRNY